MDAGDCAILEGDCAVTLKTLPTSSVHLVVTSPPYNIGKAYEKTTDLASYVHAIKPVLVELARVLTANGSICWQVGNFVDDGEVVPLDIVFYPSFKTLGFKLRNRIVWHFEHGLHASKRFSGRYETILWFTKGDSYVFNLDPVRVPSKYPGKRHFKGDKIGQLSGNPLGKNPSDFWSVADHVWEIPNVKANHPEKTEHPCQFPIELAERCVLALTNEQDCVLDPFAGVGSTMLAALRHQRRTIGCEKDSHYISIAMHRIEQLKAGTLGYRPMGKPVFQPTGREKVSQIPEEWKNHG